MDALYLISDAWGPKYGGINAFNTDFAKHLGLALGRRLKVGCIVLEADAKEIADAANCQVDLIPIGPSPGHNEFDPARAHDILAALQTRQLPTDNACWIGHDIVTGDVAIGMAGVAQAATVVLIHHMSYGRYQGYKQGIGQVAKDKHERQRAMFNTAHRVFGVGPLLRDALVDMLDRRPEEIGMIVPGLPEIVSRPMPTTFTASAFGRLDPENDRIKQGRLAVAGFASVCGRSGEPRMPKILDQRPKMWLVGISAAGGEEEQGLRAFACEQAGRAVDLDPLPYDNDRQRVLDDLSRSSVALMLSWHEGFGLTGWEAIAAEVPLILGKNSGLHQLIDESLKDAGLGCIKVIDVRGNLPTDDDPEAENFQPEDAQAVCEALLDIAHDPNRAKHNAKRLHQMLQDEGFIWEQTIRRFAAALGIESLEPDLPPATPAEPVQPPHAGRPPHEDPRGPSTDPHQPPPLLQIPSRPLRGGVPQAGSTLLRADAECVPFHALRELVLAEVLDWVESAETPALAMQLRVGAGGSGKTRLMIEACRRLTERGWCAGFLRSGTDFDPHEFARLLREHPRVLVVLDYAEARQTELVALLKTALQSPPEGQLRVMLLARAVGEWWDRLPEVHRDLEDFITGPAVGIPFRLPAVNPEARQRETLFQEATGAFAAALGRSERPAPPDLSADHFGQVLFIHLAALAALAGQRPETAAGLLDATLRREARYWRQSVDDLGLPDPARRGMEQAMALLTLTDGTRTAAQARGRIAQVPALRGADQAIRDGIQTLAQTFYPLDGGIDALRPDILGERLVARELARDDELLDLALGDGADARTRTAALSILTRLAQHSEGGDLWLRRGLERHLEACAEPALAVAVKVGDPCGRVLGEVLDAAPALVRQALCDRLHPKLPEQTVGLMELAEVVTRQRLAAVGHIPGRVPTNPKQRARLRERINDYALRLLALGRLEEAHDLWQEALGIARTLERRGDPASQDTVATALGYLGFVLSGLGRHDAAFDHVGRALDIHRALANARTDGSVSNLATSLDNAGNRLAELGRFDEARAHAEKGLQLRRRLAEARPDAFTAKLANSFSSVANCLGDQGRFDEALAHADEALQIYRRLAEARPDAFAADLAGSLGTVGNQLGDQGRFDEALAHADEALQIYRRLAEARPDAFAADLAGSLCNLGVRLSELGSFDRALPYLEESTQLFRRLAASRPDRFGADLGRNLGNQALVLMLCGEPGPAEHAATDALDLLAQQPGARSAALQGELGWALAIHAWSLLGLGALGRAAIQAGRACETIDLTLANRPGALPRPAALAYWIGWRSAEDLGDTATGQHRANQALGVLNLWVENGALALPAYLVPAATELLDADDRTPGAADRYPALKALLHRSAVG